ncbi:hypothetical protein LVJ94_13520 [Pendulispora rubella]|uniref:Uncharacterized protein n=1 Tax=Pendulispora rubella TaxID=2741070 RepID=A0ABZ2LGI6_9BACT
MMTGRTTLRIVAGIACAFVLIAGCSSTETNGDQQGLDNPGNDGGASDGGNPGNPMNDGGADTGPVSRSDGGKSDAGKPDAGGRDAGTRDSGTDPVPIDAGDPGPTCTATSGDPACDPCLAEYCCEPAETCRANPECNAIVECVQSKCQKGDNGCIYGCYTAHPRGQADVTKLAQCLQRNCSATCSL